MSPCVSAIQVSRLAGVLVKNEVQKGDLVVIYMPMVPQAMFTMLACARIGAPHSLIFGGFASKELSVRINHAKVRRCFFTLCLKLIFFSVPQQQGCMNCIIYVLIKNQGRAEVGLSLFIFCIYMK